MIASPKVFCEPELKRGETISKNKGGTHPVGSKNKGAVDCLRRTSSIVKESFLHGPEKEKRKSHEKGGRKKSNRRRGKKR